jgi:manganese/iron transport system substrate-binding protein
MLKRQGWNVVAAVSLAGLLGACQGLAPGTKPSPTETSMTGNRTSGAGPNVVATTTVLCDLTQQIAENTIRLTCLMKAGSDPHLYASTPEDRKALEEAELILYGGYNFEPSLIKIIKATSTPAPKIAIDEVAVPKPQTFEEDGKTAIDPHVWHNAQNGIRMVESIRRSLAKVSPQNAARYEKNTQALTTQLSQIDAWIKTQVATIPLTARKLVTTHDALGYYSKAYGIPVEKALGGISTEEKPTAGRVTALVKIIQASNVPTIFAESTINPRLIEAVARDAKVKIADQELFVDGLGEPRSKGDTYQKMLISNTQTIVEGLGGRFKALQAQ